ncbi:hypothetical protein [uncultured Ruminococcus sp.]|uniref:hypothetical protein n=1 Tax=uncultured Ruminococcus sp. TaxID=165186 RepID=UPI002607C4F8|nr:hypothetical protein [uncultured Ruminococcus sp.]
MNNSFTVRYKVSDLLLTLPIIAFFAVLAVFMLIFSSMKALSVVFLIMLAPAAAALIFPVLLFSLKVDGDKLYSSSRSGKKYDFTLKDIENISYREYSRGKYGPRFFLEIRTADKTVTLRRTMKGFGELAAYLLDRYGSGELAPSVIPKKSLKSLQELAQ